jgi:hypothetical protein
VRHLLEVYRPHISISPFDNFAIGRTLKMRRSAYRLIKKIGPSDLFSPNNIDWVRRSLGFLARRPIPYDAARVARASVGNGPQADPLRASGPCPAG